MYIPLTFEGALQKCLYASGGYEGYFLSGSQQWKYHQFTGSANLVVQKGSIDNVQIYVVGGGGGGARGTANTIPAGGGGGGGTNFTMNARLFQGTYGIVVGRGGGGQLTANNNGTDGFPSSIVGTNLNLVANGGKGGTWGSSGAGGASGNGFAGGSSQTENGGGGGGASAVGVNATSTKAGDGGSGVIIYLDGRFSNAYGCGGGGYARSTSDTQGFSCNGLPYGMGGEGNNNAAAGANTFGMGGGGGGNYGGDGGSGSVIIQYPIYDYCTNYFNETGSCGCRELTFDITDGFNFYPDLTGSYLYVPCGTNQFVSGTVDAYFAKTLCATSGTFYSGPANSEQIYWGFLTGSLTYPECSSGSICGSDPTYVPTCSSSYTTYFNTTEANNGIYYVPRNGTELAALTMNRQSGSYICASDGYLTGSTTNNFVAVPGVKCFNLRYQRTITPASGVQTLYWYDCSNTLRSQSFAYPNSYVYDFVASFAISGPWMTTNFASWTTIQYLSTASDYTGSVPTCGCP
jgi:hypothetical protein